MLPMVLTVSSDYLPKYQWTVGLSNADAETLLRGRKYIMK